MHAHRKRLALILAGLVVSLLVACGLSTPFESSTPSATLSGHDDTVKSVAFGPNGRWLASSSLDNTVRLWDMTDITSEPTVFRAHTSWVRPLAFSPDGRWLASGGGDDSDDSKVRVWDLDNLSAAATVLVGHEERVYAVVFSPDGRFIASSSADGVTYLWDANNLGDNPSVLPARSVAFRPDGQMVATAAQKNETLLWDLTDPATEPIAITSESHVWDLAFSPDGQTLAICTDDEIRLQDVSDLVAGPADISTIAVIGQALDCEFSPDGQILASSAGPTRGDKGGVIHLWDVTRTAAAPVLLAGHGNTVARLTFSPDGQALVSLDTRGGFRIWDLANPSAEPRTLKGPRIGDWTFSPDGEILATAHTDSVIRLWNLQEVLGGKGE